MASSAPPRAADEKPPTATTSSSPSSSSAARKAQGKPKPKSSFLSCLPCFSSSAFDEKDARPLAPPGPSTTTPANTAGPSTSPPTQENEKPPMAEKDTEPPVQAAPPTMSTSHQQPHAQTEEEVQEEPISEQTLDQETQEANSSPSGVVLPASDTEGVTSGAVMPPGIKSSTPKKRRSQKPGALSGTEGIITSVDEGGPRAGLLQVRGQQQQQQGDSESSEDDDGEGSEDESEEEDEEQSLIARGGVGIPIGEDGLPHPLLDPLPVEMKGKKCLVLDLDETLVHSSFKQMVHQADFVVPVEIENQYHNVYVIKRPGVDHFLQAMGEIYEVVIFTASLSKYADPVLDHLDATRVVQHRLFRESCYNNKGSYVKDLSQLGRPMSECIIIDNSPASYVFHVNNAVPISSWFNDPHDTELTDLVPFLTDLAKVDDIRSVLDAGLYQQSSFPSLT